MVTSLLFNNSGHVISPPVKRECSIPVLTSLIMYNRNHKKSDIIEYENTTENDYISFLFPLKTNIMKDFSGVTNQKFVQLDSSFVDREQFITHYKKTLK